MGIDFKHTSKLHIELILLCLFYKRNNMAQLWVYTNVLLQNNKVDFYVWAEEASSWKRHLKYFNLKQQHVCSVSSRQSCADSCGHCKCVTLRININVCFPSNVLFFPCLPWKSDTDVISSGFMFIIQNL
jgi:hypothetical protein